MVGNGHTQVPSSGRKVNFGMVDFTTREGRSDDFRLPDWRTRWRARENAWMAECQVPPEKVPPARTKPSTEMTSRAASVRDSYLVSACTVNQAHRSWGILSKPQQITMRTLF